MTPNSGGGSRARRTIDANWASVTPSPLRAPCGPAFSPSIRFLSDLGSPSSDIKTSSSTENI
eukprot:3138835-Prymnesium_polylepis.3